MMMIIREPFALEIRDVASSRENLDMKTKNKYCT
jgi:hypothetical protein